MGERTGNVCTEELAVVLKLKYGRDLGFRLDQIHEISQLVHRASGRRTVLEKIKKEAERRHGSVPEEEILCWLRAEAGVDASV